MKEVSGTQEVHTSTYSGMEKHSHAGRGLERKAPMSPSLNEVGHYSSGSGEQGHLSKYLQRAQRVERKPPGGKLLGARTVYTMGLWSSRLDRVGIGG